MRKEYSKDKSKDSYRYKEKNKVREEGNIKKSENHRSNHTKE